MHIVIGLILAFVIVAFYAMRSRGVRNCRWRADRNGDRDGQHRFICAACGHEAFTTDDRPPRFCKAGQPL
jgi:hypothetical protein